MKKIVLLFLLAYLMGMSSLLGQTNFREGFQNSHPISFRSNITLEEKVKAHQAYLDEAIEAQDSLKQLYAFLHIFYDHLKEADYPEAARYLLEAESIAKASGNPGWQGWVSHRRGILEVSLKKEKDALVAYKRSAKQCGAAGDSLCLAESLEQISAMYGKLGNFEEAKKYFDLAVPLIVKYGSEKTLSISLNNYGISLLEQDRKEEAIPYIKHSITIYRKNGNYREEAQAIHNLADIYRLLGQYDLAIGMYNKAIQLNKEHGQTENLINNYNGLYILSDTMGDYKSAYKYLNAYISLRDSLIGTEAQDKIADLEAKYESQRKDLELEKIRGNLLVTRRSLERTVLLLFVVLLLIGFGVWRWRMQKQEANRILAENKAGLKRVTRMLLDKNTKLMELEKRISVVTIKNKSSDSNDIRMRLYNERILTDADWSEFKMYFEKIYPDYIRRLRSTCPALSEAEERLFLFIKLNITRKEAATILGISTDSVKKTRSRLRKRLELDLEDSLEAYIRNF